MEIREQVPLSTLTTFKIGGPARFVITIEKPEELPQALAFAKEQGLPFIPLGSGSNMLSPDEGVEAVFIRIGMHAISYKEERAGFVQADAGALWDDVVAFAVAHDLWGIENLSAIPGTAGAAVVQNIGAYGAAIGSVISAVTAFDTVENKMVTFSATECRFGYRTSRFKEERDRYVITDVSFALSATPQPNLSYRDLARRYAGVNAPALLDIRDAVILIRATKFPPLDRYGTAGSFFLNPIVTEDERAAIAARFPEMPLFDMPEGGIKVPLGWILDRALSLKGTRIGGAFLWAEQALVVATDASATSADVVALADDVRKKVFDATRIAIEPEVRIIDVHARIR